MDRFKKIIHRLLYPCAALVIILGVTAPILLLLAFLLFGSEHAVSYISYAISAYALTVISLRAPNIIKFCKNLKESSPFIKRLTTDHVYRARISLYFSLAFGMSFSALQTGLAIRHDSLWFATIAGYYLLLVALRFSLLRSLGTEPLGEEMKKALRRYRFAGIILMLMNLTLAGMVFYIVRLGYGFRHHEITTIALAAFTFTAVTVSIVNNIRYRRYKSPVFSAAKVTDLTAALVSLLTLETAMLSSFGDGDDTFRRVITSITGTGVCIFTLAISIKMIISSTKKIKELKDTNNDRQSK